MLPERPYRTNSIHDLNYSIVCEDYPPYGKKNICLVMRRRLYGQDFHVSHAISNIELGLTEKQIIRLREFLNETLKTMSMQMEMYIIKKLQSN